MLVAPGVASSVFVDRLDTLDESDRLDPGNRIEGELILNGQPDQRPSSRSGSSLFISWASDV
jgi:hypothetical protein